MKTVTLTSLAECYNRIPCAIALGNFDGLHLGHQALLDAAKESAYLPAVFTFDKEVPNYLATLSQRSDLVERYGTQLLFLAPFSLVKDLSCRDFLLFLKEKLACREVICGYNFRFGKNAAGNAETLLSLGKELSLLVSVLPELRVDGEEISSSAIRALLSEGKTEEAEKRLGRPYSLSGKVEKGYSVGKKLKVPTLNLALDEGRTPLRHGVYVSETVIDGKAYPSITNIGKNPTFNREKVTCETNLFDVSGDFYGMTVEVKLLRFLRPEEKFPSFQDLQKAIEADLEKARQFHERRSLPKGGCR